MFDQTDDRPSIKTRPDAEVTPGAEVSVSPAVARFNTCRWRSQEKGRYCTHRDVLPLAGREGFKPEAWCPDCTFFKVRRAARKRDNDGFGY